MHDRRLVNVIVVEGVHHGGIHVSRVRSRNLKRRAHDAALFFASPFQDELSQLLWAGLIEATDGSPQ